MIEQMSEKLDEMIKKEKRKIRCAIKLLKCDSLKKSSIVL